MADAQLCIDFSYARPNPAAVKAAGYVAVWRYLSGGTPGKDLTAAEARSYLAVGLGIGLVWETTATRALSGAAAGTADGQAAVAQAHGVGAPAGTPLLANVGDFAASGSQIDQIAAYLQGFTGPIAAAGYGLGGYGTGFIIDSLAARGICGVWWQNAMDDNGQSGSVVSPNASVYQRVTPTRSIAGSTSSDFDEDVLILPVPFWGLNQAAASTPLAPSVPGKDHDDMIILACEGQPTLFVQGGKAIPLDQDSLTALAGAGVAIAHLTGPVYQAATAKFQ